MGINKRVIEIAQSEAARSVVILFIIAAVVLCAPAFAYDWSSNPGTGTIHNPRQIATVEQLLGVNDDLTAAYRLVSDIDLEGHTFSGALIGGVNSAFAGRFDGGNYTIRNLTIDTLADDDPDNDSADYLGLFARIGPGTVHNLALENVSVRSGIGSMSIGGLCGDTKGRLVHCTVSGTVSGGESVGGLCGANVYAYQNSITRCRTDVTVRGLDFPGNSSSLGGLCGTNSGSITSSASEGLVTSGYQSMYLGGLCGLNIGSVTGCYSVCAVYQDNNSTGLGGLCGMNFGPIDHCYAAGDLDGIYSQAGGFCGINRGSIAYCYSIGRIGGIADSAGGFVGFNSGGTIQSCLWNSETSGTFDGVADMNPDPPSLTGLSTIEMWIRFSYLNLGWQFSQNYEDANQWRMCPEDVDYPRLNWQLTLAGDYACPNGAGPEDLAILALYWLGRPSVPTELDDDGDAIVSLNEMARLSAWWLRSGCSGCGADFTGDGSVDTDDLAVLIDTWLYVQTPESGPVDLNNDNHIDLADFRILAENW